MLKRNLAKTKRCAVYTRKSTAAGLEQEFNSLDAQREACVTYIARQPDWILVPDRYDDGGFTGATIERPAFQRLLADVDAGKIDVIVCYKVDRLSRSLLDFARVMDRLNEAGTSFVAVTQNFSTADAMGRLTLNMLMSFAEFEREMIAERTRDKIWAARRKGKWTGGVAPLGYDVVDKKLVVNDLEAALVRDIFALYHEHRSARSVARVLNQRGTRVVRARGRAQTRPDRAWTRNDVLRVLKHPLYAGYISAGDDLIEGEHTSIIERTVFERTRSLLTSQTMETRAPVRNPEYLLRGLLQCGRCGAAFTAASTRDQRGRVHRYYRCVTRDKQGPEACPSRSLAAAAIEAHVLNQLRTEVDLTQLATEVQANVHDRVAAQRSELRLERRQLSPRVTALAADLTNRVDSLAHVNGSTRRQLESQIQALGQDLERHQTRLAAIDRELAALDELQIEGQWIADCLVDFGRVWELLSLENRARLLHAVIERVEVDELGHEARVHIRDLGTQQPMPGPAQPAGPERPDPVALAGERAP